MRNTWTRWFRSDRGASAVEYALLAAFIAAVAAGAIFGLHRLVGELLDSGVDAIPTSGP